MPTASLKAGTTIETGGVELECRSAPRTSRTWRRAKREQEEDPGDEEQRDDDEQQAEQRRRPPGDRKRRDQQLPADAAPAPLRKLRLLA